MNNREVTAEEVEKALKQGRVCGIYFRKHKIALDGLPARPATNEAIRRAQEMLANK